MAVLKPQRPAARRDGAPDHDKPRALPLENQRQLRAVGAQEIGVRARVRGRGEGEREKGENESFLLRRHATSSSNTI